MPAHTFHHVCLNPAPGVKQDEQAGFYSSRHQPWLTDRHTHIIHSSQAHHTVQLCWVLTDTSQQQLYSKWNRENNNESDAWRCLALFCLCMAAIAAHSGCSSILLPELDSCPLIYIPNLAAIEIPRLLVNSLSLSCSTSQTCFGSSDNFAKWCRCLVNQSKYVWGESWLCLMGAENQRLIKIQLSPTKHEGYPVDKLRWM